MAYTALGDFGIRAEDIGFRRDVAKSMGVGFELPKTLTPKLPNVGKSKKRRFELSGGNFSESEILVSGVNGRDAEMRSSPKSWKKWGERRGLNPRPSVPQTDALPAELRSPKDLQYVATTLSHFLAAH